MKKYLMTLVCVAAVFLFPQCRNQSEEASLVILPDEGSWFFGGEDILLVPVVGDENDLPDKIFCTLEQGGVTLFVNSYPYDKTINITVPEKGKSGILHLSCAFPDFPDMTRSVDLYYFKHSYERPEISYYPPVPMAGSIVEAICPLETEGDDPYIIWEMDGRPLGEGYVSEGADRLCFYGAREKGSYTLTAEVFPDRPLKGGDTSPLRGECEIFFDEIPDREGLLDPGEWENLFQCDGTHIDRGNAWEGTEDKGALTYLSSRSLGPFFYEGDRGYAFGSSSYLRYDGKILQGRKSGHSRLSVRMILKKPEAERDGQTVQIFNTRDGTGDFGFSLFRRGNSLLLSSQSGSDRFFRSEWDMGYDRYDRPFWLSMEVVQKSENLLIRWFVDGILEKEDLFEGMILPGNFRAEAVLSGEPTGPDISPSAVFFWNGVSPVITPNLP